MSFYVRLDESSKSPAQIAQRECTYAAAKLLREAGIKCEVREFLTGKSITADAAGIFLKLEGDP